MSISNIFRSLALKTPLIGGFLRDRRRIYGELATAKKRIEALLLNNKQLTNANLELEATSRSMKLLPRFVAHTAFEFNAGLASGALDEATHDEANVVSEMKGRPLEMKRFCLCCEKFTEMLVDFKYSSPLDDGSHTPNWRERLVCAVCQMNNRQRLIAQLVKQSVLKNKVVNLFFMEQVTAIFQWATKNLPGITLNGSEYLGDQYKSGEVIGGIRHEDVTNLSFPNCSIDFIVSNDVFEHVPDILRALQECNRVLTSGGTLLATIPFDTSTPLSVRRAEIKENGLNHILSPQYHGNPLSAEGSLVFHDFGWDLLDMFAEAGFATVGCEFYSEPYFGHLGPGLLIFRASKAAAG